jgi:hypothetical protein
MTIDTSYAAPSFDVEGREVEFPDKVYVEVR